MSKFVEFPGREPPPEGYSEQYIDKLHSEAFRDLEGDVCDLERMGQIAQDLIAQCVGIDRDLELSSFAVMQLAKMLREFKDRYYKAAKTVTNR
jgi:hypothetical protein